MESHATQDSAHRATLDPQQIAPAAKDKMATFHPHIVAEVAQAVRASPVVVVGMSQNPHVKHVRARLSEAGIEFTYLEYGSYLSKWKERLAIKLWSGWPTFPQVFVRGVLIGGRELTERALADGSLKSTLTAASPADALPSPSNV